MATILDNYAARNKKYQDWLAAQQSRQDNPGTDPNPGLTMTQDADAAGRTQAKDALAAAAPPDTYGAVLRELARARTQMMIRNTNGRAGSLLGIGAGDQLSAPTRGANDRLTLSNTGGTMQRMPSPFDNARVARFARLRLT